MTRAGILPLLTVASLTVLASCDRYDPYLRTDVWKPTGSNAANIAAMVADPHDLVSGHGVIIREASEPALAVGHIVADQPKSLQGGGGAVAVGAVAVPRAVDRVVQGASDA